MASGTNQHDFEPERTSPPTDNIFDIMIAFRNDPAAYKVDLAPGVYRTDEGLPWILPSVKQASIELVSDESYDHEYLPIGGLPEFVKAVEELVTGPTERPIASIQVLSGTGGNRMAALYLAEHYKFPTADKDIYISDPTWFNHYDVFRHAGLRPVNYPYWNKSTKSIAFDAMLNTMQKAPDGSVFCLHACGHNPTGTDPTNAQWQKIAKIFKRKNHFALFDAAYLGFVSGDIKKDKFAIDLFLQEDISLAIAVGLAKTTGMYSERVGCLHLTCDNQEHKRDVKKHLCLYSRWETSGAPAFGAQVMARILRDPQLRAQWHADLQTMASRIETIRQRLYSELLNLQTPGDWSHIANHRGMFSYTGLSHNQCSYLMHERHVYLPYTGRISISGVNTSNVSHIAREIDQAVRKVQD